MLPQIILGTFLCGILAGADGIFDINKFYFGLSSASSSEFAQYNDLRLSSALDIVGESPLVKNSLGVSAIFRITRIAEGFSTVTMCGWSREEKFFLKKSEYQTEKLISKGVSITVPVSSDQFSDIIKEVVSADSKAAESSFDSGIHDGCWTYLEIPQGGMTKVILFRTIDEKAPINALVKKISALACAD